LSSNPPKVELRIAIKVANAVDFGTEFPIANRFGGDQKSQNILILLGSGKRDPNEKESVYTRVAKKAQRLGVTIIYINLGFEGGRVVRDVERGDVEGQLKKMGANVVNIPPQELTVEKAWEKTAEIIYPKD
jgi:hypothetical protein